MRINVSSKAAALTAALGGVAGLCIVATPQASAAPGDCAPSHRNYHFMSNPPAGEIQIGTVGIDVNACPSQPPTSWTVTKGEERTGAAGGLLFAKVEGIPVPESTGQDRKVVNVRLIQSACVPVWKWFVGPDACSTESEWVVKYTLTKVNDEVLLDRQTTQVAGQGTYGYYIKES